MRDGMEIGYGAGAGHEKTVALEFWDEKGLVILYMLSHDECKLLIEAIQTVHPDLGEVSTVMDAIDEIKDEEKSRSLDWSTDFTIVEKDGEEASTVMGAIDEAD